MTGRRSFLKSAAVLSVLPAISIDVLASNDKAGKFRVMTANIRVDLKEDEEKGVGWKKRKDYCFEVIKKYNPDIVGLQEVFYQQAIDLRNEFKEYYFLGYDGPEMDGITEYAGIAKNPLLIRKSRFELLSAGIYWLSETPHIAGSEAWGTYRARHVNYALLKDLTTGKSFRFSNTHLTTAKNSTETAKIKQVEMIGAEANQYKKDFPQILTGDFNSAPTSAALKIITDAGFVDEYAAVNGTENTGATGHAFLGDKYRTASGKMGNRIDYILTKGKLKAQNCILVKDSKNGFYPSDHYFMYSDIGL